MKTDVLLEKLSSGDLNDSTEAAFCLSNLSLSQKDIIKFLNSDNQHYKNVALLKIQSVTSHQEASILMENLVGNSTKVRDLAAQKIRFFIEDKVLNHYFQDKNNVSIIQQGIVDINPNVCRNIINSIIYFEHKEMLLKGILDSVFEYIEAISQYKAEADHSYYKNLFKVYWSITTITTILNCGNFDIKPYEEQILELIEKSYRKREYTIREKSAQLALCFSNYNIKNKANLDSILLDLSNDENFYVGSVVVHS